MFVFVSWSGEESRQIARILVNWLEGIVQHVNLWMSDDEIKSGARWRDDIGKSLNEADYGLVCVTRTNQESPWLMFEAGALAKRLDHSHVVPLCIDIKPSDITSPLQMFQARNIDRAGMHRLVSDLHSESESRKSDEVIDRLFERMWPDFESAVLKVLGERSVTPAQPQRTGDDMLAELIVGMRNLHTRLDEIAEWDSPPDHILETLDRLSTTNDSLSAIADDLGAIRDYVFPVLADPNQLPLPLEEAEARPVVTRTQLSRMSNSQLTRHAASLGIPLRGTVRTSELIEEILKKLNRR